VGLAVRAVLPEALPDNADRTRGQVLE